VEGLGLDKIATVGVAEATVNVKAELVFCAKFVEFAPDGMYWAVTE
jgi:hypothetical protein